MSDEEKVVAEIIEGMGDVDNCPKAPHGGHEPDGTTASLSRLNGKIKVFVRCEYCGRLGSAGELNLEEISW